MSTIIIRPSKGLVRLGLRQLWEYRELLYFLVWRDVKVRYKQTVFGASWAVIQPFMLMVVFSVFLGRLAGVPSEGLPYPLFAFSALVPWTLFSQVLAGASNSLVNSANLISKVYFPRLLLPLASAGSFIIDFLVAMVFLAGMMVFYGVAPGMEAMWLPALAVFSLLASLSVGIWLAALNVRYRDVRHAVPFLVQLWLFSSPVAYSSSLIPEKWRTLYALNPMTGVVEGFRWALFGTGTAPQRAMFVSAGATVLFLLGALVYFRRVETSFADVI